MCIYNIFITNIYIYIYSFYVYILYIFHILHIIYINIYNMYVYFLERKKGLNYLFGQKKVDLNFPRF